MQQGSKEGRCFSLKRKSSAAAQGPWLCARTPSNPKPHVPRSEATASPADHTASLLFYPGILDKRGCPPVRPISTAR